MIHSWKIGAATVTSIVEYYGPTHQPEVTFPEFDRAIFDKRSNELPPTHWYPDINRFVIAIQIWAVFVDSKVIIIDTGVGNGKIRPAARMNLLNSLVPQWMAAAGVTRENVTHVVMTHLHSDHIGWNTTVENGRSVPTFPNARYLVPRRDFAFFKKIHDDGKAADTSFTDSLLPVLDAGLVDFIDAGDEIAGCLRATDAIGHTPGQLNYWLRDGADTGVFSADIFHHPVQILNPGWNTAFCTLQDDAKRTRLKFLNEAADAGALVMPCHFPPPHCGFVRRQGDAFAYEPAH